ncbi:MAG: phosphomannose isomerase type II C-terminal cupin domain [Candidatus Sungbacteria bacterium]|uniref:Phosphomannose isomerase type II C-terminal cupin domain n=1 Tax=Candidatus Sungiibacteriota bacterium TaxID=2750080 RepID=A0A932YYR7_9BACT|nr:phosphomannose isomerase type II C-terminal cupin domain [Candidatus Sungbacteria bacterium]
MEALEVRELPWGREEVLIKTDTVAVKLITVKPGQRNSLQRHARRAESWTILSDAGGTVHIDEAEMPAKEGAMFSVPVGALHRFTAPPDAEMKILEVWSGECDQNDIERLEDDYGRV